jgi:hypothetical protein
MVCRWERETRGILVSDLASSSVKALAQMSRLFAIREGLGSLQPGEGFPDHRKPKLRLGRRDLGEAASDRKGRVILREAACAPLATRALRLPIALPNSSVAPTAHSAHTMREANSSSHVRPAPSSRHDGVDVGP